MEAVQLSERVGAACGPGECGNGAACGQGECRCRGFMAVRFVEVGAARGPCECHRKLEADTVLVSARVEIAFGPGECGSGHESEPGECQDGICM